MSGIVGNNIVRNGLVLNLDAADRKSYPGSGTTWFDRSGNKNNGTLTNGPTFDSANGGSIVFDGTNDYVSFNVKLFTEQKFSLGFWINVNTFTGVNCSGAVANSRYTIFGTTANYQGYTNTFSTCIQTSAGSNAIGTVQQSNFLTNTWYYYFTVYDGSLTGNSNRLKLWLNNIQYSLVYDATVPSTPYNNNTSITIGYGPTANMPYFNGEIANVVYYNRALSVSEISQNFNANRKRFNI